jgi:hypothetical protein
VVFVIAVNAAVPSVPPEPIFNVDESVPESPRVLFTVSVLDVVPPASVNPVVNDARVSPLTVVGVTLPRVRLIAGVVVAVATVPETPLAVVTETEVTEPLPLPVAAPNAPGLTSVKLETDVAFVTAIAIG